MTSYQASDPPTICLWHATSSAEQPGPIETTCQSWLSEEELERAARFRKWTNRNQHIIGRGMARRLLADEGFPPQEIRFAEEAYGKPYVTSPAAAKRPFNVAHTDGLVVCGLSDHPDQLLGVDVERLCRRTDPGLAERYFAPPEVEILKRCPREEDRQEMFLRIWTLKESYIKAIGTGLRTPLADFAFEQLDLPQPRIRLLNPALHDGMSWHFFSLRPRPGFVGAVAVATPQPLTGVAIEVRSFDDLLLASVIHPQ